ncbi:hypothetical protein KSP40_PGU011795 [Platanthera guangdongensis]|uniref:Uncharacterized protein n=1 Tax=Platanthera guangdongensis TaxID=2320717 RepID=A0ABR2MZ84_9ASPA
MAFARDLMVFAALNCFPESPSTAPFVSSSSPYFSSKIHFSTYSNGASNKFGTKLRCPHIVSVDHNRSQREYHCFGVKSGMTSTNLNQEADDFLLNAVKINFFQRFTLAWKILFL